MASSTSRVVGVWFTVALGVLMTLIGVTLIVGGAWLLFLGGSA